MAFLSPTLRHRYFTAAGLPLAGGKIWSYAAGTTTPLPTFTDRTESIQNANPLILDANGEGQIWLGSSAYKFILMDSSDVVQWTVDNVRSAQNATFEAIQPLTTKGDLLGHSGSQAQRFPVGTDGKVLTADSPSTNGVTWALPHPLTTKGDLFTFGAAISARLAVGSNNQILIADSAEATGLKWGPVSVGSPTGTLPVANGGTNSSAALSNNRVIVSSGGAIVESSALSNSTPMRTNGSGLPTTGNLNAATELTGATPIANGGTGQTSATAAFDALSPLTTKGDIIANNGTNDVRLAVGSNGHVLTADSAEATGMKWATVSGASGVPTATVLPYAGSSAPTGFLLCDGTAVSRATYSDLFAVISTTYGVGDGSTTFNVPDTRGIFIRGVGTQSVSGQSYSGTLAVKQADQMQGHYHRFTRSASLTLSNSDTGQLSPATTNLAGDGGGITGPTTDGTNGTPRTGTQTHPANISFNHIIKT